MTTKSQDPKTVGFVGDVHGNLSAFRAVIGELNSLGVSEVIGLGDWVGYSAQTREVLDMLTESTIASVAGNHDRMAIGSSDPSASELARTTVEMARSQLLERHRDTIASLPATLTLTWSGATAMIVHGTPTDPIWGRLTADSVRPGDLPPNLDYLVTGATHRPLVKTLGTTTIINPGSVGLPRDRDPRASFAVLDVTHRKTQIHRVTYNPSRTALANLRHKVPHVVNDYLFLGSSSPEPLSVNAHGFSELDEVGSTLEYYGFAVTPTAAGMFAERHGESIFTGVSISILSESNRVLIRSYGSNTGGRERDPTKARPREAITTNGTEHIVAATLETLGLDVAQPKEILS